MRKMMMAAGMAALIISSCTKEEEESAPTPPRTFEYTLELVYPGAVVGDIDSVLVSRGLAGQFEHFESLGVATTENGVPQMSYTIGYGYGVMF